MAAEAADRRVKQVKLGALAFLDLQELLALLVQKGTKEIQVFLEELEVQVHLVNLVSLAEMVSLGSMVTLEFQDRKVT